MVQLDGSDPMSWVVWINLERARRCEAGGVYLHEAPDARRATDEVAVAQQSKAHRLDIRESLDHWVGNVPPSEGLLSIATVSSCARSPHAAGNVPASPVKSLHR